MRRSIAALAIVGVFVLPGVVSAQLQRSTSQTGMFGARSIGGGITNNTQSQGGLGQSGGGMQGSLDPSFRNNASGFVGASAANGGSFVGSAQAGSSGYGAGQYGGMGRTGGMGMSGARGLNSGMGMGMGGLGMMGLGGLGGMQGFGSQFGRQSQFGRNNQMNRNQRRGREEQQPFRTTYRTGFQAPARNSAAVSTALQRRLQTSAIEKRSGVQVQMAGRTAVLRGTVATHHDRDLAERMALLEPGISQVQNELQVAQPEELPVQ